MIGVGVSPDIYVRMHIDTICSHRCTLTHKKQSTYQGGGAPEDDGGGAEEEDVGLEGGQLQLTEGVLLCIMGGYGCLWTMG